MERWMSSLPVTIRERLSITELALPGSHNSGTTRPLYIPKLNIPLVGSIVSQFGKGFAQCQNATIIKQLQLGVRCFDIRVGIDNNGELRVCHTMVCDLLIEDVIKQIVQFLETETTEIVVLLMKWDWHLRNQSSITNWKKVIDLFESNHALKLLANNEDLFSSIHHLQTTNRRLVAVIQDIDHDTHSHSHEQHQHQHQHPHGSTINFHETNNIDEKKKKIGIKWHNDTLISSWHISQKSPEDIIGIVSNWHNTGKMSPVKGQLKLIDLSLPGRIGATPKSQHYECKKRFREWSSSRSLHGCCILMDFVDEENVSFVVKKNFLV